VNTQHGFPKVAAMADRRAYRDPRPVGHGLVSVLYWSTTAAEATMTACVLVRLRPGRFTGCATTHFGSYPFRIEVDCAEPSVDDRPTALSMRAHNLAAVAQFGTRLL